MPALAYEDASYTYADVLGWDETVRAEIIGGELYMMAPPSRIHQDLSRDIFVMLCNFLKGRPCKAYAAPFGVRLFPQKDASDDTYLEPDITVVCDKSKLDQRGCNGPPDLIVEILSPSSARLDQLVKFQLYQRAGVREYWIVDPENRLVLVYTLENGAYLAQVYGETGEIPVSVLPGCLIPLKEIFPLAEEPPPNRPPVQRPFA